MARTYAAQCISAPIPVWWSIGESMDCDIKMLWRAAGYIEEPSSEVHVHFVLFPESPGPVSITYSKDLEMRIITTTVLGICLVAAPAIAADKSGSTTGTGAPSATGAGSITAQECQQQRVRGATIDPRCKDLDRNRSSDMKSGGPADATSRPGTGPDGPSGNSGASGSGGGASSGGGSGG